MPQKAHFLAHLRFGIGKYIVGGIGLALILNSLFLASESRGATSQSSGTATGNPAPAISAVSINNGSAITLTANATTTIRANFTVTDYSGCPDVFFNGWITSTIFRSGAGETCSFSYQNCYVVTTTASSFSHGCTSITSTQTTVNATATFDIYYFAQATDASSSFPTNTWHAYIQASDVSSSAPAASSTGVELNTLLAIDVTTSTNYGTVSPGENTSSTNQIVEVRNAGNSSSSLNINGTALCSGATCMATSSQHYATSSFTYGGAEQALQQAATLVSGFLAPPQPLGRTWTRTTNMPDVQYYLGGFLRNGYAYTLGGWDTANTTATVRFAPINATGSIGAWTNTTALPGVRSHFDSPVHGNYVYAVGGRTSPGNGTTTVSFAPINATGSIGAWTNTTALPSAIFAANSLAHNGYLYFIGGENGSASTATVRFAPINATGSIGSWTNTTALPNGLSYISSLTYQNYLYVLGGWNGSSDTSTVRFAPINATGSIGAWTNTQSLPRTTDSSYVVALNGYLYLLGGWDNVGGSGTSTNFFARFRANGEIDPWQSAPSLPGGIYGFVGGVHDGKIYTLGGGTGSLVTSTVQFTLLSQKNTYWGAENPAGTPQGDYTGTNTFTAVFSQ